MEIKGEYKKCPFCNELNRSNVVRCSCGYYFDKAKYSEKISEENTKQLLEYKKLHEPSFVVYFTSFTMPLAGIILGTVYVCRKYFIHGLVMILLAMIRLFMGLLMIT